jgi:hypothetical protein
MHKEMPGEVFLYVVLNKEFKGGGRDLKKKFAVIISKEFASIPTFVVTDVSFSTLNDLASQGDR